MSTVTYCSAIETMQHRLSLLPQACQGFIHSGDWCVSPVAQGWKEVKEHIHTGQNHSGSDMGRIYYRVDRADSNKLFVVVHHKQDDKEQQRFFERLAKR